MGFYSPHNNNKIIIKSYTGDEDEHQLEPELASDIWYINCRGRLWYTIYLFSNSFNNFEIKPKGVDDYLTYVPPEQQLSGGIT